MTSKLHAVEEWNHLVKKILKPYPDERGSFVKTKGRSLKSFFGEENMRHMAADAQVCELAARPGMGLNLLAASCQQGLEALMCITDDADPAALKKTKDLFGGLADLMPAMQVNNKTPPEELKKAIRTMFDFAAKDPGDKLKALAKLAEGSSRLYGFSVQMAQWLALASKPKVWAKSVPSLGLQHPSVQAWCVAPSDVDKAVQALADSITDKFHWGGHNKGKRKFGEESEDSDKPPAKVKKGLAATADSTSSESSSSDKKKSKKGKKAGKKKNKDKKSKKAKKASSSSASEKFKGAKKDKKKDEETEKALPMSSDDEVKQSDDDRKKLVVQDWELPVAQAFGVFMDRVRTEEPRPTFESLKEKMGTVPDSVLKEWGLLATWTALKTKTKYPKKEHTDEIVKRLTAMCKECEDLLEAIAKE